MIGALVAGLPFAVEAKLTPAQIAALPAAATEKVEFARDIQPIFEASCVKCHGHGKAKGGFRLDTRAMFLQGGDSGAPARSGQSADSLLVELVSGLNPDNVMPQKGSKLTPQQVGLLRAWIDQGLPWDERVNFGRKPPANLNPRQPAVPPPRAGWEHPIDRLLEPYLSEHRLALGERVDDRTFARRAFLDAIGLLPVPAEIEAFLADTRPDKRERLVDRLLADQRRYAEHWLSFWNDVLRNDYSGTGYIDGGREPISRWLYSALYENTPYDRFVSELIHPTSKSKGFVKGILWRGVVNASQTPEMQAAQNIAQVFMGVNLKCASCHDSFINDWSLADAYGLASVYATNGAMEMFQCDKPTGKKSGVAFIYPELGSIDASAPLEARTQRLAEIMTAKANGRLTRTMVNRLWARFLGRGLVEPVDDMDQPAWHPDLLDWLAEDLTAHGYDLKRTMKWILTSRAYQSPSVNWDESKRGGYVFTGPVVRRMSAEQFRDALGKLTGVWFSEPSRSINLAVTTATLAPTNRLPASAKWIWSEPDAASKARAETVYFWKRLVLAEAPKEAWAVATCDNSYTVYINGERIFAGKEWTEPNLSNIKSHLQAGTNVIAIAAVNYKPDGQPPEADKPATDASANPGGLIFFARIRTTDGTREVASDESWAWSKEKKDGWEKPAFVPENPQPAAELGPAGMAPWNLDRPLAAALAMSQAHSEVRASLVSSDPLALALGRPPREQVVTARPTTATTLQALELTNGETLSKLLQRGAEKVLAEAPTSKSELVQRLYTRSLGRSPTDTERKLADDLLSEPPAKDDVEDLLWSLAMLPEFQLIY